MCLIFAAFYESTHLIHQASPVTRVTDVNFTAPWQHRLLVEHRASAVKNQEPSVATPLRISRKPIESAILTELSVSWSIRESSHRGNVSHVNPFALQFPHQDLPILLSSRCGCRMISVRALDAILVLQGPEVVGLLLQWRLVGFVVPYVGLSFHRYNRGVCFDGLLLYQCLKGRFCAQHASRLCISRGARATAALSLLAIPFRSSIVPLQR